MPISLTRVCFHIGLLTHGVLMRFGTIPSLSFNLVHPDSASLYDAPQTLRCRKLSRLQNELSLLCCHSGTPDTTLDVSPFFYRIALPPSIQRMNPSPHVFIRNATTSKICSVWSSMCPRSHTSPHHTYQSTSTSACEPHNADQRHQF